jgi:Yip1-like protein
VIRRLVGVFWRPRTTFVALIERPAWVGTWAFILICWAVVGGWLLSTDVGQQALIDERVRVIEAFGGAVSDAQYRSLQAQLPWWIYATSGGRFLLNPALTLAVATGLWLMARADGVRARFTQALSIVVHASLVLLLGQLVATPIHYVRETLTSPLNLATVLPLMEDGTAPTRFAGSLDLFALWWAVLLAIGLSVLTRRQVMRYVWSIAAIYAVFATVVTGLTAAGAS